jgi:phage terminase large subunit
VAYIEGRTLKGVEVAEVFLPLMEPARYKGLYGGRGAGKSHFFAELVIRESLTPGTRIVCIREHQVTLAESVKHLIEDKLQQYGLGERQGYRIFRDHIETPGGGRIDFIGMQDHTADSLKSLEGYRIAWVEQAEMLSQKSFDILRPTIRMEGSELWFSWNPRRKVDPVDVFFRQSDPPPKNAVFVMANWRDMRDAGW